MKHVHEIFSFWYIKVVIGFLLTILSPVETSVIIVFIMIVLDTFTGTTCAIKLKRFNSKFFRKSIIKLILYGVCILTVRLIEIGALMHFDVVFFTQFVAGFLIITEGVSVLENLIVLGLPLPSNFLNILFKQIRIRGFENVLKSREKEKKELEDIEDILYLQIPMIKCQDMRKLLQVYFKIWLDIIQNIINYFEYLDQIDNELLFYKVISIIKIGLDEFEVNIGDLVSRNTLNSFQMEQNIREENLFEEMKELCCNLNPKSKKKEDVIRRITIFLYQTILNTQKQECTIN